MTVAKMRFPTAAILDFSKRHCLTPGHMLSTPPHHRLNKLFCLASDYPLLPHGSVLAKQVVSATHSHVNGWGLTVPLPKMLRQELTFNISNVSERFGDELPQFG